MMDPRIMKILENNEKLLIFQDGRPPHYVGCISINDFQVFGLADEDPWNDYHYHMF